MLAYTDGTPRFSLMGSLKGSETNRHDMLMNGAPTESKAFVSLSCKFAELPDTKSTSYTMGDSTEPTNNGISNQPGIMIVRPILHEKTMKNAETFKRWTVMHFRDLLNLPPRPDDKGISRALRYTNTKGDMFYTIHADDIRIWRSQPYYEASRRLDLENTRPMEED